MQDKYRHFINGLVFFRNSVYVYLGGLAVSDLLYLTFIGMQCYYYSADPEDFTKVSVIVLYQVMI